MVSLESTGEAPRRRLAAIEKAGRPVNLSGKDVIHVALSIHYTKGTYSPHAGVVMVSIFERTQSAVLVHILHDDTLSPDNRAMFAETAERFGQRGEFHDV